MILEELAPAPDSKKLAQVTEKTFGYSVDLKRLDLAKAKQIKEAFTQKLAKMENKLGANASTNKRYYEAKLVLETVDRFIEEGVDEDALRELELYAENDGDLYRQSYMPIAKNLSKKFKKGVYNEDLAKKVWKYHADRAAQKYGKEFGEGTKDGLRMFSPDTRRALAAELEESWRSEMELGNFMEDTEVSSENIITEGEMEQAEVVMAAKNIVDRIQGMVEDLGEIMNEDLPPLADTITDQFGAEASTSFTGSIQGALGPAMEAMGAARSGADAAARGLTGESAPMMGDPGMEEMPMEPTTDMEMDMEQPAEEPAEEIATADASVGGEAELGRERR
mgnify:CR=1 FL=1